MGEVRLSIWRPGEGGLPVAGGGGQAGGDGGERPAVLVIQRLDLGLAQGVVVDADVVDQAVEIIATRRILPDVDIIIRCIYWSGKCLAGIQTSIDVNGHLRAVIIHYKMVLLIKFQVMGP